MPAKYAVIKKLRFLWL